MRIIETLAHLQNVVMIGRLESRVYRTDSLDSVQSTWSLQRLDSAHKVVCRAYEWHPSSAKLIEPLVYLPNTSSPNSTLPVTANRKPVLYVMTANMLFTCQLNSHLNQGLSGYAQYVADECSDEF
jgi:hypothetical protein